MKVQELQPLSSRVDVFSAAVDYSLTTFVDYKKIADTKSPFPVVEQISVPDFIQLHVDEDKWAEIVCQIRNSFTPPLRRVTAPYAVKLVLLNYLLFLDSSSKKSCITPNLNLQDSVTTFEDEISLPEMAKVLFQMMLTDKNCYELQEIQKILTKWRIKNETSNP